MGKKKGKKNENAPEASGAAPQKTLQGPSREASSSQPGNAQQSIAPSVKPSDGAKGGLGNLGPGGSKGPPPQKSTQGAPSLQPQKSAQGPKSGKPSSQSGSGGPQPQKQSKGSLGGPPSKKQPQGAGVPTQKPQGLPPPQGATSSQPLKSAWGQPPGKPPFQSGADNIKRKAVSQSQSTKENVPPKQMEQKPTPPGKDEGKQGGKSPISDQPLLTIPPRVTDGGVQGRQTSLQVNLLQLNFNKICQQIIHYDVVFDPDKPKRLLRPALDIFRAKHFSNFYVAFDGRRNLYTARRLPFGMHIEDTVVVQNPERTSNNELEFQINIKYAQSIDTTLIKRFLNKEIREPVDMPQTAIQALDIVLRTALSRTPLVPVGRSYFIPSDRPFSLGGGLDMWYGFYQSAVLNWKPFLNVDVAHKGFPKPILLTDLLKDVCGLESLNQPLNDDQIRKFKGFITTLKIRYEIKSILNSKRIHRVNNLGKSAREHTFESNDVPISIIDFYRREKRYEIKYPDLPTVQVDPAIRAIYLPMELCTLLPGQSVNRKLDQIQTRAMIKEAAKPPSDRKERIMNAIRAARYNESPVVQEFGISVNNNFEHVPARILQPPAILYRNECIEPTGGQWGAGEFLHCNDLKNWVILNLDYRTEEITVRRFSKEIISQGKRQGMKIAEVMEIKHLKTRGQFLSSLKNLFDDWKEKEVQLVLVVLPPISDIYGKVKQTAELQVGILTQCVKCSTLKNERSFSSTCENIVKKINAKTNGVNHQLGSEGRYWPQVLATAFERPIMFVGIDVTHPSPDQKDIPSVAAVSASHDTVALFQYNMIWRLQPPRVEIIQDLKNIMKEHLVVFYQRTRRMKPHRIIVYRDGVSEGQFRQVLTYELMAIRQACLELQSDYNPGITFLVVQKRHHIRFFPTNERDADRKGNVLPGTIVDREITHPRELDFYLASHASLQGTTRPTKYHRLWDDNRMSEDDLEVLTYYLCHLFSRCTRSVSYPAPTYYAHLAAYRARAYLENNRLNVNEPGALERFQERNKINPAFRTASPMFFV